MRLGFSFKTRWAEGVLVVGILLVAAFVRLYRLDQLPPGLHYDEAFNTVEAQKVLAGTERPIFFSGNIGEEPMAMYAAALVFGIVGASPWSIRLTSALAGLVTVAALYLLARELFAWGRPGEGSSPPASAARLGLGALAAFVLAILYWHVSFSRLGMETIFLPLVLTLALAFFWRARRSGRVGDWALAGLFAGATLYTYKSALFVPLLLALVIGVELALDRTFRVRDRRGLVIFGTVAVLVFAPLGLYFATHPGDFLDRPSTVVVAGSGVGTLIDNALRVAGMFFVSGDMNPRSNLPGRPVLDPFLALGFVAGLATCLYRIRRPEARFLLLWLAVMLLPSVLTDYAPHMGRTIGAAPAVALIVAWGFYTLWSLLRQSPRVPSAALSLAVVAGLATSTYATAHDYFDVWGGSTGLDYTFDAGLLSLAEQLRARPGNELVYITPTDQAHFTLEYGLGGRDARSFDGRHVLVIPPSGQPAAYGIVTREDPRSMGGLAKVFPAGGVADTIFDSSGQPFARIFHTGGDPQIAPTKVVQAHLGDTIQLLGYDWARDREQLILDLYWGSIAETSDDYTVFVHLIGARNPETGSPIWAQADAQPGQGSYPTFRWQAGEVIVDEYRLSLPANLPRGDYEIEVGMYTYKTGRRVPVTDANGAPLEQNRVLFETIALP